MSIIEDSILGVIGWYPASGYDIKTEFELGAPGFFGALSFGSIYPKLEQLEQQGLIEVEKYDNTGRLRKTYELTAQGWQRLREWVIEVSNYPLPFKDELLLKMSFWGTARPEDRTILIEQLEWRRNKSQEYLKYILNWPTNGESLVDEYGQLLLSYLQSKLEAEQVWLEMAITQLAGPPKPPIQDPHNLTTAQKKRREAALEKFKADEPKPVNATKKSDTRGKRPSSAK